MTEINFFWTDFFFQNGVGDANDVFRVEIVGGKDGDIVETVTSKVKFVHYFLKCVLTSSGKQLPKWGFEQQEVSCASEVRPPPTFVPAKVERIFDYKTMVRETREKYKKLPEIQQQVYDMKRKTSFRTNRIMRDMYKKKLQEKVLRGRVSHNHHNAIV